MESKIDKEDEVFIKMENEEKRNQSIIDPRCQPDNRFLTQSPNKDQMITEGIEKSKFEDDLAAACILRKWSTDRNWFIGNFQSIIRDSQKTFLSFYKQKYDLDDEDIDIDMDMIENKMLGKLCELMGKCYPDGIKSLIKQESKDPNQTYCCWVFKVEEGDFHKKYYKSPTAGKFSMLDIANINEMAFITDSSVKDEKDFKALQKKFNDELEKFKNLVTVIAKSSNEKLNELYGTEDLEKVLTDEKQKIFEEISNLNGNVLDFKTFFFENKPITLENIQEVYKTKMEKEKREETKEGDDNDNQNTQMGELKEGVKEEVKEQGEQQENDQNKINDDDENAPLKSKDGKRNDLFDYIDMDNINHKDDLIKEGKKLLDRVKDDIIQEGKEFFNKQKDELLEEGKKILKEQVENLKNTGKEVFNKIKDDVMGGITDFTKNIMGGGGLDGIDDKLGEIGEKAGGELEKGAEGVKNGIGDAVQKSKDLFNKGLNMITESPDKLIEKAGEKIDEIKDKIGNTNLLDIKESLGKILKKAKNFFAEKKTELQTSIDYIVKLLEAFKDLDDCSVKLLKIYITQYTLKLSQELENSEPEKYKKEMGSFEAEIEKYKKKQNNRNDNWYFAKELFSQRKKYFIFHFEEFLIVFLRFLQFIGGMQAKIEVFENKEVFVYFFLRVESLPNYLLAVDYNLQLKPYADQFRFFMMKIYEKGGKEKLTFKEEEDLLVKILKNEESFAELDHEDQTKFPPYVFYNSCFNSKYRKYWNDDEHHYCYKDIEFRRYDDIYNTKLFIDQDCELDEEIEGEFEHKYEGDEYEEEEEEEEEEGQEEQEIVEDCDNERKERKRKEKLEKKLKEFLDFKYQSDEDVPTKPSNEEEDEEEKKFIYKGLLENEDNGKPHKKEKSGFFSSMKDKLEKAAEKAIDEDVPDLKDLLNIKDLAKKIPGADNVKLAVDIIKNPINLDELDKIPGYDKIAKLAKKIPGADKINKVVDYAKNFEVKVDLDNLDLNLSEVKDFFKNKEEKVEGQQKNKLNFDKKKEDLAKIKNPGNNNKSNIGSTSEIGKNTNRGNSSNLKKTNKADNKSGNKIGSPVNQKAAKSSNLKKTVKLNESCNSKGSNEANDTLIDFREKKNVLFDFRNNESIGPGDGENAQIGEGEIGSQPNIKHKKSPIVKLKNSINTTDAGNNKDKNPLKLNQLQPLTHTLLDNTGEKGSECFGEIKAKGREILDELDKNEFIGGIKGIGKEVVAEIKEIGKGIQDEIEGQAKEIVEDLKGKGKEVLGELKGKAQEVVNEVQGKVNNMIGETREKIISNIKGKASEVLNDLQGKAAGLLGDLEEKAEGFMADLQGKVDGIVDEVNQNEEFQKVKEVAKDLKEEMKNNKSLREIVMGILFCKGKKKNKKKRDLCYGKKCSIFRNIDKIRITYDTIDRLVDMKVLKNEDNFEDEFYLRNFKPVEENFSLNYLIIQRWNIFNFEKQMELIQFIRNFYGEKVAFYFLWCLKYIRFLFFLAFISIVFKLVENYDSKSNFLIDTELIVLNEISYVNLYDFFIFILCIIVGLWSSMFLNYWENAEEYYAYIWGTEDVQIIEPYREEFQHEELKEFIFDKKIPTQRRWVKRLKQLISAFVILIMGVITVLIVNGLLQINEENGPNITNNSTIINGTNTTYINQTTANVTKSSDENDDMFNNITDRILQQLNASLINNNDQKKNVTGIDKVLKEQNLSSFFENPRAVLISIFNGIQIEFMSWGYSKVARMLNNWENHEKESDYENNYIIKVLLYDLINNFNSMFYIGFVKPFLMNETCIQDDCWFEMDVHVFGILMVKLVSKWTEFLKMFMIYRETERNYIISFKQQRINTSLHSAHHQRMCNPYTSLSEDFNEMLFLYCYVVFFSSTNFLIPLVCLAITILKKNIDAYKICHYKKVNMIQKAKGIQIYNFIFKIFHYVGIVVNISIMIFSSDYWEGVGLSVKFFTLIVITNSVLLLSYLFKLNYKPKWFGNRGLMKTMYNNQFFYLNHRDLPHLEFIDPNNGAKTNKVNDVSLKKKIFTLMEKYNRIIERKMFKEEMRLLNVKYGFVKKLTKKKTIKKKNTIVRLEKLGFDDSLQNHIQDLANIEEDNENEEVDENVEEGQKGEQKEEGQKGEQKEEGQKGEQKEEGQVDEQKEEGQVEEKKEEGQVEEKKEEGQVEEQKEEIQNENDQLKQLDKSGEKAENKLEREEINEKVNDERPNEINDIEAADGDSEQKNPDAEGQENIEENRNMENVDVADNNGNEVNKGDDVGNAEGEENNPEKDNDENKIENNSSPQEEINEEAKNNEQIERDENENKIEEDLKLKETLVQEELLDREKEKEKDNEDQANPEVMNDLEKEEQITKENQNKDNSDNPIEKIDENVDLNINDNIEANSLDKVNNDNEIEEQKNILENDVQLNNE